MTLPSLSPQFVEVLVVLRVNVLLDVIITVSIFVQPLASVAVAVYVPAPSPVTAAIVWLPGFHK